MFLGIMENILTFNTIMNVLHKRTKLFMRDINPADQDYFTDDWIVNPDLSAVQNVDNKYWNISGSIISEMTQDEKDIVDLNEMSITQSELISRLWNDYNEYANSQMDVNSRHSINLMTVDVNTTSEQMNRILEYGEWWKNLWLQYELQKYQILQGNEVYFDVNLVGPCPYTIWDISKP